MTAARRLAAFLCAAVVFLAACEGGDIAVIKDFVQQWILDHPAQLASAKFGIPSGDNLVDAAVEGYDAVKDLKKADDLMDEGRAKQDPAKMDEALAIRPHDWTYELSRGSLALQLGDMATVTNYGYSSFEDSKGTEEGIQHYYDQRGRELELVHQRLNLGEGSVTGYRSYAQCAFLYDRLRELSTQTTEVTKPPSYWAARRQDCEQLPH